MLSACILYAILYPIYGLKFFLNSLIADVKSGVKLQLKVTV